MKNILFLDAETYSETDLTKTSVYRYVEDPTFEIQLLSYSFNGGNVITIDLAQGEKIPNEVIKAIYDKETLKVAHNANFERIVLSRFLGMKTGVYLPCDGWYCTMVHALTLGLPASLANLSVVLKLKNAKMNEGKDLIRFFAKPIAPTKKNDYRTRNYPHHDINKWNLYKEYNKYDVLAEIEVYNKLSLFPMNLDTYKEWILDSKVNDRGIMVDMELVNNAMELDTLVRNELMEKMRYLTNIANPNSVVQLKDFLVKNGIITDDLGKKNVTKLIETAPDDIKEILKLRQQISKSSIKKYLAIKNCVCSDGRVRGLFQFYGASRTGREAGRLVQLQNLPQNHIENLDEVRNLLKKGDFNSIKSMFDDVPQILSELIRTAFIAKPGYTFIDCDFSAIEARVIAYLSGEEWRLEAFKNNEDIYCASASKMFGVPVVKNGENGHLRPKGKIAELALAYGGSVGALTAMGALEMGLTEEELQPLVHSWRNANHNITRFWWTLGNAIKHTIQEKSINECYGLRTIYDRGYLFIELPSKRRLAYPMPRVVMDDYGKDNITYLGETTSKVWGTIDSYPPKFAENVCQAVARDLLFFGMKNLDENGIDVVATIHDECLCEVRIGSHTVEEVANIMSTTPSYMKDIPLKAEGFTSPYFKKD